MRIAKQIFVANISSVLLLLSCKQPISGHSDEKTLDNFAAQTMVSRNSCSGAEPVNQGLMNRTKINEASCAGSSDPLCQSVSAYLSAVPRDVQAAFDAMGGSISIRSDAVQICQAQLNDRTSPQFTSNASAQQIDACYVYVNDTVQRKSILTFVMPPDAGAIRYQGVRLFGFFFAQFVPYTTGNRAQGFQFVPQQNQQQGLLDLKSSLANAFLTDLANIQKQNPQGMMSLSNMNAMLGENAHQKVINNLEGQRAPLEGLSFASSGESLTPDQMTLRKLRFMDFVFAESFDSQHCSQETRAKSAQFALTMNSYRNIDAAILARARDMANGGNAMALAKGTPASASKSALSLNSNMENLVILKLLMASLQGIPAAGPNPQAFSNTTPLRIPKNSGVVVKNNAPNKPSDSGVAIGNLCQSCSGSNCSCPSGSCSAQGGCSSCSGGSCSGTGCSNCSNMMVS